MHPLAFRLPRSPVLLLPALLLGLLISACGSAPSQNNQPQSQVSRYVGAVSQSSALIGLVTDSSAGKLAVYVCDSKQIREFFSGTLQADGSFTLTNASGAQVTDHITNGQASGTFTPADEQALAYTAAPVSGKAGIYRVDETVNGVHYTGGWVLGPNGEITGLIRRNGVAADAAHLDPTQGTVKLPDGATLTPQFIDQNVEL